MKRFSQSALSVCALLCCLGGVSNAAIITNGDYVFEGQGRDAGRMVITNNLVVDVDYVFNFYDFGNSATSVNVNFNQFENAERVFHFRPEDYYADAEYTADLSSNTKMAGMETYGEYGGDGGCDCRVGTGGTGMSTGMLMLLLLGLALVRRP